jgi:hypothetical protein
MGLPTPNKALQLTRRRRSTCGSPPAGGRPFRGSIRRPPAGCIIPFHGGAQLSANPLGSAK